MSACSHCRRRKTVDEIHKNPNQTGYSSTDLIDPVFDPFGGFDQLKDYSPAQKQSFQDLEGHQPTPCW
jgi:hypothetical protein